LSDPVISSAPSGGFWHRLANPARFQRFAGWVTPWLLLGMIGFMTTGLYFGLYDSPIDYQQKDTVRIMYVHVPAAWLAMMTYSTLAISGFIFLVWRHPLADVAGAAAAPIGAMFTALALITGAIWGQPTWGTWWVWDARLTSVLVLFFLFVGYIALRNAFDDEMRAAKSTAILAIVGAVNLPIIKFSVEWWNTLHQPASVSRLDNPAIDPAMLRPLLLMALGYLCLFLFTLIFRMRLELVRRRINTLQYARAGRAEV
jgi:heme exporter protein C